MEIQGLLDRLPLWGLFVVTVAVVLLAVEVGYRVGRRRGQRPEQEKESSVGAMVGATLGLLGFLLAFTFGMAASRFDSRRQVLLDEVNAIGTTYLRAALLPKDNNKDPGAEVRRLLREYVDIRLQGVQSGKIEDALKRSEELHGELWSRAVAVGTEHSNSIVVGLFIEALNGMIDLHSKRVMAGLRSRVPETIWFALYAITLLAMGAMGYHAGLAGKCRSLAIPLLVFAFSMVMYLIADLDRPGEGILRVSQQPMMELRNSMK